MATVSERSRELLCAIVLVSPKTWESEAAKLIEQALLAERRLAMEEAAKIAEGGCKEHGVDDCWCYETGEALRKLATPRGGE
jgi:hypothetical protein